MAASSSVGTRVRDAGLGNFREPSLLGVIGFVVAFEIEILKSWI
jgi:hypothetical protein